LAKSIANRVQVTDLARTLALRIPRLAADGWTRAVWRAFKEIEGNHNKTGKTWILYPEGKPYKGEVLLDFMIYEENYGPRILCESQWQHQFSAYKAIEWAFDKLRLVKGDIKVLIYEVGEQPDGGQPPKRVTEIVSSYLKDLTLLSTNEAFLLMNFNRSRKWAHWWKPTAQGNPRKPRFSPIMLD
jgi:hypothetical protein